MNSSAVTAGFANNARAALADLPYYTSSSSIFYLAKAQAEAIYSKSSNATLGINLGTASTGGVSPSWMLENVALAVDNTTGMEISGTDYYSVNGNIGHSVAAALTTNYQTNRDSNTPSSTNGFLMERSQFSSLIDTIDSDEFIAIQTIRYFESTDTSLNILVFPASSAKIDLGTVYFNRNSPRPLPPV